MALALGVAAIQFKAAIPHSPKKSQLYIVPLSHNASYGSFPRKCEKKKRPGKPVIAVLRSVGTSAMDEASLLPYTPHHDVAPPQRSEWWNVCFILFAELVGTGVLALPFTLAQVGLIAGVAIIFASFVLSVASGLLLWRLHALHPDEALTYGALARCVMRGTTGSGIVQSIVSTLQYVAFFGNMAINLLLVVSSLRMVLGPDQTLACYSIAAAVLLPLAQIRTLHGVSWAGLGSSLAIATVLAVVLGECYVRSARATRTAAVPSPFEQFSAAAAAIFAFGGQGLFMETMAEMRDARDFKRALLITSSAILCIYLLSSVTIFDAFGDAVPPNAMEVLPDGPARKVAAAAMAFHVAVSYLLANAVIGRAIHLKLDTEGANDWGARGRLCWLGITSAAMALCAAVVALIPNLSQLMGLVGALSTAPLSFGFPAFFFIVASKRAGSALGAAEVLGLWAMVALTVVLVTLGLAANAAMLF